MKSKLGIKLAALGAAVLMTLAVMPASQAATATYKWKPANKVATFKATNLTRSYVAGDVPGASIHVAVGKVGTGKYLTFAMTMPKGCKAIRWDGASYTRVNKSSTVWKVSGSTKNQVARFANMRPSTPAYVSAGKTITYKALKTKPNSLPSVAALTDVRLLCRA